MLTRKHFSCPPSIKNSPKIQHQTSDFTHFKNWSPMLLAIGVSLDGLSSPFKFNSVKIAE